jgi:acyl-CoA reductase-like NAD-dependent aldehyde dehydrogenase
MEKLSNFINGKSVDSKSGKTTDLVNPATTTSF